MNDPRFRWGDRFIELREDASVDAKQKFGARNREGWAAYFLNGQLFIKTFACLEGAEYPDMGVNCEFYTQPGMLEVETLGPLATLEPGAAVEHGEHWHLFDGVELPDGELGLAEALAPYVAGLTRPMR
jgi:hypothetical protein